MIYFIVNPAAGSGKAKEAVPIIDGIMGECDMCYSFIYTNKADDFTWVSGLIDQRAAETIICVGGDGTVQEYVGLAAKKNIKFGIIPAGSGNDFILSMPDSGQKFRTFEEKITFYTKKIIRGEIMNADAVAVNGERYFFNIGGTGIDIQVLKDALPIKKFFGGGAYFLSLIKNAVTYKTEEITLTIDGKTETDEFLLLAVCNGAYYGGNLNIAPSAVINDGLITLCKVRKMPRFKLMALFPAVKPGRHTGFREVSFINCSAVKLEYSGKKTINLDGNLSEFESPLTFDIVKGAVRLII